MRHGYGASLAATIESVAIMGPARLMGPLTQGMTAPMLGRLEARGAPVLAQVLACGVIRLAHNAAVSAFFIWVIVGGLDAYGGTFDSVEAILPFLPGGSAGALALTAAGLVGWAVVGSAIQVSVYRRGLTAWPPEPPPAARAPAPAPAPVRSRFDPRAVVLAAAIAFGLLLTGTAWPLLAAVAVWLALVTAPARGEREILAAGAALGALLAAGALFFGLVSGLGADLALRRAARAALLVLAATWLRAAAGADGVREVARRALGRLRGIPSVTEAGRLVEQLGSGRQLIASGRSLADALRRVARRPVPVLDAVLGWVAVEAGAFVAPARRERTVLAAHVRDAALVASALVPTVALGVA